MEYLEYIVSVARIDLGIGYQELRGMTLRQFFLFVERLEKQDRPRWREMELMLAQIVAMVGNTGFRSFKEWRQPQEFMPSLCKPELEPTEEDIAAKQQIVLSRLTAWMESGK